MATLLLCNMKITTMTKYLIAAIALISYSFTQAQRQVTEKVELRVSTITFQEMVNGENKALNYHKTVNQAFKDILDGQALEGMMSLKPTLHAAKNSLAIDWFMGAFAYAMLSEKQGVELMLNEAISRDGGIDSLMRTPLPVTLLGGFLGERAWNNFLGQIRNLNSKRPDLALINKLRELEALELAVVTLEQEYKDSILVHHKGDKNIKDLYQTKISDAKVIRDKTYANVIDTDAWPFTRMRNLGQTDAVIPYENTPNWFEKNQTRLVILLHEEKLLPWEFAFVHDWHAKQHNLPQKYALFYGKRLDEKIVMNCEAIGMPWGAVRDFRMYYILPAEF